MPRRLEIKGIVVLGSLLSGGFSLVMAGMGLWLLWQSALGRLTLTRPGAVIGMVFLGVLGLILSGLYALLGWQNLELQRRGQQRAAELEAALRRVEDSEARSRGILEAAPDATLLVDREGDVVMANAEAERMFGYPRKVLVGMRVEQLMPERFREVHVAHRAHYYAYPHARSMGVGMDLYGLRQDGSEFPLELALSPLETPEGMLVIASIRDVTERRRVSQEMAQRTAELQKSRELNQLKDHFLSSLSHEMKTPLSLICGYAELLEEKYPDERLLEGILQGSQRLNDHISNLLDYSAMVSGTLPLYKTEVNLAEQLQNILAAQEESMRLKGLHFSTELDPETPAIHADPRRISQMIGELIRNAIKFTPEGGSLGIRIRPEAGMVRIEVWDTGPGIPEGDRQKIWSAFTQLEVGDTLRRGGLGLGLTIVSKLAELHGGMVELDSEVGRGSRFIVTLPVGGISLPAPRITRFEATQEQPAPESPAQDPGLR